MKIIKLNFTSSVHVGDIGIGLEECSPILHSDTIFNAIINAYSFMHSKEETDKFVKKFEKVRISSAFPFSSTELYFPKPKIKIDFEGDLPKGWKNTEFISKGYFEKIINNEKLEEKDIEEIIKKKNIYKEYQTPKVYLDRETKKSDFFFIGSIKFEKDCGLWFTVDCENGIYKDIISCLRLLQDEGIGGKRTWGQGLFTFEEGSIELKSPQDGNCFLLLSLLYPDENERALFSEKSSWDFAVRGGYSGNERKPRVRMIKEGSVFDNMPDGRIINFDKHSLYGKGYSIKIKCS